MANEYKVNGQDVKYKVNAVIEIIRQYISENSSISYPELKSKFPNNLGSSSTGVLKDEDDLKKWEADGRRETRNVRFKTKDDEILTLKDGTKVYISSQWGDSGGEGTFKHLCDYVENEFDFRIENLRQSIASSIKNIILYGSPGVGKTHNTNKLISLIEEGKGDKEIFEAIKSNEKSDSIDISDIKDRVKFITFHQSFGYEDFI